MVPFAADKNFLSFGTFLWLHLARLLAFNDQNLTKIPPRHSALPGVPLVRLLGGRVKSKAPLQEFEFIINSIFEERADGRLNFLTFCPGQKRTTLLGKSIAKGPLG